jgi:hypothetical protein
VKPPELPPHKVLTWRELGTNYMVHAIECEGARIHSQLGPYGVGEVEQRVREYVASGSGSAPDTIIQPLPAVYRWTRRKRAGGQ